MYLKYFLSVLVWQVLNPFGIAQSILQNAGQIIAILRSWVTTDGRAVPISMSLPFRGRWTVINGGIDKVSSHSWKILAQRFAYDFICSEATQKNTSTSGGKAGGYSSFGQQVLAPADGRVVKVKNNLRDFLHAGTGAIDIFARDMRGNHLIVRHGEHLFSLIAHLQKDSCRIKPGELVKQGQVIGLCGNSGHSSEPHVHFQLQDRANFYLAIGLPIVFANLEIERHDSGPPKKVGRGYISKNCTVRNLADDEKTDEMLVELTHSIAAAKGEVLTLITNCLNLLGLLVWLFFIYIFII